MDASKTTSERDISGVVAPPPLIFLAGLAVGFGLEALLPGSSVPDAVAWILGGVMLVAGIVLLFYFERAFQQRRTPANPWRPTTAIATDGPYRLTRNPAYVGMALVYIGIALCSQALWGCCRCRWCSPSSTAASSRERSATSSASSGRSTWTTSGTCGAGSESVAELGYRRHGHHLRGDVDREPPRANGCKEDRCRRVESAAGLIAGALDEILALVVRQAEQVRLRHRGPSVGRFLDAVEQCLVRARRHVVQGGLSDDEVAEASQASDSNTRVISSLSSVGPGLLLSLMTRGSVRCGCVRIFPRDRKRGYSTSCTSSSLAASSPAPPRSPRIFVTYARVSGRGDAAAGRHRARTGVVGGERKRHGAEAAEQVAHQVGLGVDRRVGIERVEQSHRLGRAGHELCDALGARG